MQNTITIKPKHNYGQLPTDSSPDKQNKNRQTKKKKIKSQLKETMNKSLGRLEQIEGCHYQGNTKDRFSLNSGQITIASQ